MRNYFFVTIFLPFFSCFYFFISASGDQSVSCSVKKATYEWPEEEDFFSFPPGDKR